MAPTAEKHQSIWLLAAGPSIWAAHFVLSYATAAIWCAKVVGAGGSLTTVRVAIAVYTLLALAGLAIVSRMGYLKYRFGEGRVPHDADTPEDRHRFLGFSTLLLSSLSAVAVLYGALVALFFVMCH